MAESEVRVTDDEVTVFMPDGVVSVNRTRKGEHLVTVNRSAGGPTEIIPRVKAKS
jgi:hypothetical protein